MKIDTRKLQYIIAREGLILLGVVLIALLLYAINVPHGMEYVIIFAYPSILITRFIIWSVMTVLREKSLKIPNMKLTRTTASLLSLLGPLLIVGTLALFYDRLSSELQIIIIWPAMIGFIVIRVYFASWYVRDKKRNPTWSALSIIGFWGWVILWSLKDYGRYIEPEYATCETCNKTYFAQNYPNNHCPDCGSQLILEL